MKTEQLNQAAAACEIAEIVEISPLGWSTSSERILSTSASGALVAGAENSAEHGGSSLLKASEMNGDPEGKDVCFARLKLSLRSPAWANSRAGQFVMIRPFARNGLPVPLAWGHDIIWARAFSICEINAICGGENEFQIVLFIQLAGRGTSLLLNLNPGDRLLVWGPLGNCFAVEENTPTLILAGGMGLAPFIGYSKIHGAAHRLRLEFGHRAPLNCFPWADLPEQIEACAHFEQSKDDLTAFLALLSCLIKENAAQNGLVLACGPRPFLKYIQREALECGARTQLSLETKMACGSGACLGCTVKAGPSLKNIPQPDWPVQVCLRGPVFWADEVRV